MIKMTVLLSMATAVCWSRCLLF